MGKTQPIHCMGVQVIERHRQLQPHLAAGTDQAWKEVSDTWLGASQPKRWVARLESGAIRTIKLGFTQ